jgi:hypothetical protein
MTSLKLLSGFDRRAEPRGPKILIAGVPGVGKTTLINGVASAMPLLVEGESGDIGIRGLDVASVHPRTWPECRDIAAIVGGPDPALPASAPYSQAHSDTVMADPAKATLADYPILFVDSITQFSRICRIWAEQQPESFSHGKKDLRGTYGLVAREMISWFQQLQHARAKTVVLLVVLEKIVDDYGVSTWGLQLEGQATARQLPAIVDEVITLHFVDFGDGKPIRAFVCTSPNGWNLPAKDRSGLLDQFEEPHLGKLLAKLTSSPSAT